jgi:threonine dehydrogenase-like Zn-dependent dehydrogenase
MLVAELTAPRQFRLVERPLGPLGAGSVRVKVNAVGICGSDVHSYSEGAIGDTPCQYPMVLGHEPAGTVVETGAGVTGWAPGDRAALEPAVYCYHCEFCRAGKHNLCANLKFLSNPGHPGFFREFVDLPPTNLLAIPPGLSFEMATLVEPLAVALHSLKFAALQQGETVALFGAGPIGLLTLASLVAAGAGRTWVIEPVAHRRALALQMGAAAALDPNAIDVVRQIESEAGGRGLRHRLRGQGTYYEPGDRSRAQRRPRGADRDSLRQSGAFRSLSDAAQRAGDFQRTPLEPRVGGRSSPAGGSYRVVRPAGHARAPADRYRRSLQHRRELRGWGRKDGDSAGVA